MARFCIERLHINAPAQADVPGKRLTVNLPEPPKHLVNRDDLVHWFRDNPEVPFAFHSAIIALTTTFTVLQKPH